MGWAIVCFWDLLSLVHRSLVTPNWNGERRGMVLVDVHGFAYNLLWYIGVYLHTALDLSLTCSTF